MPDRLGVSDELIVAVKADNLVRAAEFSMNVASLIAELQTGGTKYVKAVSATKRDYPVFKQATNQDGITVALEKELSPLLTLEAVLELSADVHTALKNAQGDAETDPEEFFAAVNTAAYLATSCQKLVTARSGEIAAVLQYDAETAHKWAVQIYGSQNTLMGASPAAVAFQLAKAAEPKPAPRAAAASWPSAASQRMQRACSGGRGRGSTGARAGRNTALAEQRSGPGVDAQARAQ